MTLSRPGLSLQPNNITTGSIRPNAGAHLLIRRKFQERRLRYTVFRTALYSLQVDKPYHTRFCSDCLSFTRRGNPCFPLWVSCYVDLIDNEATNGRAKEAVLNEGLQLVLQCSSDSSPFHLPLLARRNSQYR
jgi:hypothetical protein